MSNFPYVVLRRLALALLALQLVIPGQASDFITATITITNVPAGLTSNLVVNATTRSWTNDASASPSTLLQVTNTTAWTATNLLNHLTVYSGGAGLLLSQTTETNVILKGTTLTVTVNGGWGYVTYNTNTLTSPTFTVRVPITVEDATNQTNIASAVVAALVNSTNALGTNWTAGSNYLQKGAGPRQRVLSEVEYQTLLAAAYGQITNLSTWNSTNRGYLVALTNGYWTNGVAANLITTNATNFGLAFSSPGSYPGSEQFAGGQASGGNSLSIMGTAGTNAIAVGLLSSAGYSSVAIGNGADLSAATNSIGLGQNISIGASSNAVALGQGANVGDRHHGSIALGQGATTTTNLQVMAGGSTHTVRVPGKLEITGTQTNTVFTGTNKFELAVSYSATNITTLANGANDLDPGFKTYLRVSGPTLAYSIDKIDRGYDGRVLIIQKTDSLTLTIPNNSGSGVLPDAAKILTGTGGTLTITNNPGFVELIYDATATRWGVRSKSN